MHALPKDMAQRMRSYMHQQKGVLLREDAKRALPFLSPSLQIEVTLHVNRHWLDDVWFIKGLEPAVKVRLAMAMENKVLAPGEMAPLRYMYVIARGRIMFDFEQEDTRDELELMETQEQEEETEEVATDYREPARLI